MFRFRIGASRDGVSDEVGAFYQIQRVGNGVSGSVGIMVVPFRSPSLASGTTKAITPVSAIIRKRRREIEESGFRLFCLDSCICSCVLAAKDLVQSIVDYISFRGGCQNL